MRCLILFLVTIALQLNAQEVSWDLSQPTDSTWRIVEVTIDDGDTLQLKFGPEMDSSELQLYLQRKLDNVGWRIVEMQNLLNQLKREKAFIELKYRSVFGDTSYTQMVSEKVLRGMSGAWVLVRTGTNPQKWVAQVNGSALRYGKKEATITVISDTEIMVEGITASPLSFSNVRGGKWVAVAGKKKFILKR